MLKIEGLRVNYGGIQATAWHFSGGSGRENRHADRRQRRGKVHHAADGDRTCQSGGGSILWDGQELLGRSIDKIIATGIAMSPEGRRVFPDMTVLENLKIGAYLRHDKAEDRPRTFSGSTACFPGWRSGAGSWRVRCPAASSKCWLWGGR